jgi:hypothetical protein
MVVIKATNQRIDPMTRSAVTLNPKSGAIARSSSRLILGVRHEGAPKDCHLLFGSCRRSGGLYHIVVWFGAFTPSAPSARWFS